MALRISGGNVKKEWRLVLGVGRGSERNAGKVAMADARSASEMRSWPDIGDGISARSLARATGSLDALRILLRPLCCMTRHSASFVRLSGPAMAGGRAKEEKGDEAER